MSRTRTIVVGLVVGLLLALAGALIYQLRAGDEPAASGSDEGDRPPKAVSAAPDPAPAGRAAPAKPVAPAVPQPPPEREGHDHPEPVASGRGSDAAVQSFDPDVPLEAMLERRPELIRILRSSREHIERALEKARAANDPDGIRRNTIRLRRLEARIAELQRRQAAREPAR